MSSECRIGLASQPASHSIFAPCTGESPLLVVVSFTKRPPALVSHEPTYMCMYSWFGRFLSRSSSGSHSRGPLFSFTARSKERLLQCSRGRRTQRQISRKNMLPANRSKRIASERELQENRNETRAQRAPAASPSFRMLGSPSPVSRTLLVLQANEPLSQLYPRAALRFNRPTLSREREREREGIRE